jgi:hypothetical protein
MDKVIFEILKIVGYFDKYFPSIELDGEVAVSNSE